MKRSAFASSIASVIAIAVSFGLLACNSSTPGEPPPVEDISYTGTIPAQGLKVVTDTSTSNACALVDGASNTSFDSPPSDSLIRSLLVPKCRVTVNLTAQLHFVKKTTTNEYPFTPCKAPYSQVSTVYQLVSEAEFEGDTSVTNHNYTDCGNYPAQYTRTFESSAWKTVAIPVVLDTLYDTTYLHVVSAPALTESSNVGAGCRGSSQEDWRTFSVAVPYDVESRQVSLPVMDPWESRWAGSYCKIGDEFEIVIW